MGKKTAKKASSIASYGFSDNASVLRGFELTADEATHNGASHAHKGSYKGQVKEVKDDAGRVREVPHGRGTFRDSDILNGYEYFGNWTDGKMDGEGRERFEADGREVNGIWRDGKYTGETTVFKLSLVEKINFVYDNAQKYSSQPLRTLQQRYADGKQDALDSYMAAGALPILEHPVTQNIALYGFPPLGTFYCLGAMWSMITQPWNTTSQICIHVVSVFLILEGLAWIILALGPYRLKWPLRKVKWLGRVLLASFLELFLVSILLLANTLDDQVTGHSTFVVGLTLITPAFIYVNLFNSNFVKHLLTNFRRANAKNSYEKELPHMEPTDYPVSPTAYVLALEIILLVGLTFESFRNYVNDGEKPNSFHLGVIFVYVCMFSLVFMLMNLVAKRFSPNGWAYTNFAEGYFISHYVWWNNVFSGLVSGACFAACIALMVFLFEPGRRVDEATGFGAIILCLALHQLFGFFMMWKLSSRAKKEADLCVREDRGVYMKQWSAISRIFRADLLDLSTLVASVSPKRRLKPQHFVSLRAQTKISDFALYEKISNACRMLQPIAQGKMAMWSHSAAKILREQSRASRTTQAIALDLSLPGNDSISIQFTNATETGVRGTESIQALATQKLGTLVSDGLSKFDVSMENADFCAYVEAQELGICLFKLDSTMLEDSVANLIARIENQFDSQNDSWMITIRRSMPRFKAAPLKSHERAIEKIHRCYQGSAHKVVDIVRGSIVCATIPEVRAVLQVIANDKSVEILRLKNRFALSNDAEDTAGYRDMSMNLRIVSEEQPLVKDVVFELQILLASIFNLKSDAGHANYKRFRNMRAA